MADLYGFDLGNSRLKLGRRSAAGLEWLGAWPHDSWPASFPIPPGARVGLCSVNPPRASLLIHRLAEQQLTVELTAQSDGGIFRAGLLSAGVESPETTGADRLLAAAAAHHHSNNHPAIIVDAGSAVTVDLVVPDGTFFGGAIIPGLRLMANALVKDTAALPPVTFDDAFTPRMPGTSTVLAIRDGIVFGLTGAIDRLIDELNARLPGPAQLYITGGDGPLFQPLLLNPAIPMPLLVLEGLFLYADLLTEPRP